MQCTCKAMRSVVCVSAEKESQQAAHIDPGVFQVSEASVRQGSATKDNMPKRADIFFSCL